MSAGRQRIIGLNRTTPTTTTSVLSEFGGGNANRNGASPMLRQGFTVPKTGQGASPMLRSRLPFKAPLMKKPSPIKASASDGETADSQEFEDEICKFMDASKY